jgi:hypothetical protein
MQEVFIRPLPQYMLQLHTWLSDWYDHAYRVGYVHPPFKLDETVAERLEGYFNAGLTPAEGAVAFFGVMH